MDWFALLLSCVAPAHTDLFHGLRVDFRPPGTLEIRGCPPPEKSDRLSRLCYARWDFFDIPKIQSITIYEDDSPEPLAVLSRAEAVELPRIKRMDFEYLARDNYRPALQLARRLNTKSLLEWVKLNSKPTALTCNEDGTRTMISHSYAEWCDRSWLEFMQEDGGTNLGRWVQGETKRMLAATDREGDRIITNFEYRARLWNQPDNSYIWVADIAEIDVGGRSHRLLIFHDRQPDNLVSV